MNKFYKLALPILALCMQMQTYANNVIIKTQKAVGETITLATDANITLSLTWGNGESQVLESTGLPFDITVKDTKLTISSEDDITRLYTPNNGLTEIDLSGVASTLTKLSCASNNLTELNWSACTKLQDLDCQDNQLETMTVRAFTNMKGINCADNKLKSLNFSYALTLDYIIADNNQIENLPSGNITKVRSLFYQNNKISTLDASKITGIKNLAITGNTLTELDLTPNTQLKNLWAGDNKLINLDLTSNLNLVTLIADNNQLTSLVWTKDEPKNLQYLNLSGNYLYPLYFPTVYKNSSPTVTYYKLDEQKPFILTNDDVNINVRQDWNTILNRNAWSVTLRPTIEFVSDNTTLVSGTDYKFQSSSSYNTTFLKAYPNVVAKITASRYYPDITYTSQPFNIVDPTVGINNLSVSEKNQDVEIYTLEGIRVSEKNLPKGIYIINGKKTVIK